MPTRKGSDNRFPLLRLTHEDDTPATPPTGESHLVVGVDKVLRYIDDDGLLVELGTGAVAQLDDVGDVNAAAPSNGQVLTWDSTPGEWVAATPSAGGIASGTSFPGSPATNDLFYRTDRAIAYYYDGTRWLCICPHTLDIGSTAGAITADSTSGRTPLWTNDYDMWLVAARWSTHVDTTNSGSHYWILTVTKRDGASASTIVTANTSADSANVYVTHETTIGALLGTAQDIISTTFTKNGSPGALSFASMLEYRLVG